MVKVGNFIMGMNTVDSTTPPVTKNASLFFSGGCIVKVLLMVFPIKKKNRIESIQLNSYL